MASLHRMTTTHDTDGYIFTPVNAPVFKNRHETMFKWKFHPTIDVRYVPGYRMFCMNGKIEVSVAEALPAWHVVIDDRDVASLPSDTSSSMILELTLKVDADNQVKCRLHRFRKDKVTPNDFRTIEGIFQEIQDSVPLEALLAIQGFQPPSSHPEPAY